jgi:hypothetical protein
MPVFTAIAAGAAAIATAVGFGAAAAGVVGAVAAFAARTLLTIGISKLLINRANKTGAGSSDAGARVQLPPATDNKLPVVYGSAFIAGSITDAKLTTDQTTMFYVVSLAEVTNTTAGSAYTYGDIYYDGKLVTFGTGGDAAKVVSLTTNTITTPEVDTKIAGNLFIYLFTNGYNSGVNTGGQTAIQILSDSSIPSNQRWDQGIYTASGQSATMTNTAFAIVKVVYNQDAGTTSLGALNVQLQNSLNQPGAVIKDYLLNTRYGCGVPLSRIDTASLATLDAYSAQTIVYVPVGGGTATQARYRINGPLNTGNNCLSNLQQLADSCDSWLQYSELTGEWRVVINRSYTDFTTLSALYSVDDDTLIGGIEVNPLDLNSIANEMEVQYPNYHIKDQTDFQVVSLFTAFPSLLSPNEPINRLIIQYPQVNNAVQAKYLGLRRLLQGREDLVISFATDYSGIQVEAGDVIKVTLSQYGWTNKLFRVSNVAEEKYGDGSLGTRITAFEYNDTVYADNAIQDFVPAANTGLSDPNIIGTPAAPTVVLDTADTIASMTVTGVVPSPGQVLYLDFNYGNTSNSQQHLLYTTVAGNGQSLTANASFSITSTDLPADSYYWSITAKNNSVGVRGPASSPVVVWPGPSVTPYDPGSNTGGISGNNIKNDTITNNNVANSTLTGSKVANNTISSNNLTITGVVANTYARVANLAVDASGRITSVDTGSATTWVIRKGNTGSTNPVDTLVITGPATVTTNSPGNVNLDIAIQGLDYFPPPSANTFIATGGNLPDVKDDIFTIGYNEAQQIPGDVKFISPGTYGNISLPATGWYPWYTKTSSTVDGYLANSSASLAFSPANARAQKIDAGNTNPQYRGLEGWWGITRSSIPAGSNPLDGKPYDEGTIFGAGQLQIFTDANTTIWVCPYVSRKHLANNVADGSYVYTDKMTQVYIPANTVQTVTVPTYYFTGNTTSTRLTGVGLNYGIGAMGLAVRVPDPGVRAYITSGYTYLWYWPDDPF